MCHRIIYKYVLYQIHISFIYEQKRLPNQRPVFKTVSIFVRVNSLFHFKQVFVTVFGNISKYLRELWKFFCHFCGNKYDIFQETLKHFQVKFVATKHDFFEETWHFFRWVVASKPNIYAERWGHFQFRFVAVICINCHFFLNLNCLFV